MGLHFLPSNTAVIIQVGPFYAASDGVTPATALTITDERISLTAETYAGSAPTYVLDNIAGATTGTSNDLNYITSGDNAMMQIELSVANNARVGFGRLTVTNAAAHVPVWEDIIWLNQTIWNWFFGGSTVITANTTQLAGQTVTAGAGVTFPMLVASTTNITAGTITTVTNLTNAPSAGDFTATMKTSIGTAVAASAVASVTGNVGGNVTGNVGGNVTGNVTGSIGSLAAQAKTDVENSVWNAVAASHVATGTTGYILSNVATGTPPTAAAIADAVWDETAAAHVATGSTGYILSNVATGTPPTAAAIADAVWDEVASGHVATGTTGLFLSDDHTKLAFSPSVTAGAAGGLFIAGTNAATTITTALTTTFTGNLSGNVTGSVGSVAGNVSGSVASVVNVVNANVVKVNEVDVDGTGQPGDRWGPA